MSKPNDARPGSVDSDAPFPTNKSLLQSQILKADALQHAIFNSAHFSSIATDEHGVIQIFNVGAERMLGYVAEDVVNRVTPADISDPDELICRASGLSLEFHTTIAPGFEALVFKASRGIEDIYELTYIRRDGSRFPAVVSVTGLRDAQGMLIGYLLIGTDNTARKQVDEALSAKNLELAARTADLQFFRTAMDATADAIVLISRNTMRFVELNATTCALLGYSRAELLCMGPNDIVVGASDEIQIECDAVIAGHAVFADKQASLRCKNGEKIDVEIFRQTLPSGDDWIIVCVMRDISERKAAEERMYRLAHFDPLTGLPNRTLFYESLKRTLARAAKSDWMIAVFFIDLDNFKNVNDTMGHDVGDELLHQVSNRLTASIRIRDTVGRLGGDEFALILIMKKGQNTAAQVATKIENTLRTPFRLNGHDVLVSASIGITLYPDDATDPQILLQYADTAMYQAKQSGRNTYRFFTAQMNVDAIARRELEVALRFALEHDEFVLHYQPKVDLVSGKIEGFEALLRWERPGHGLLFPGAFIPALEETGLIVLVGKWVIGEACRQIGVWMRGGIGPVRVAVNVSGRQFVEGDLYGNVTQAIHRNAIRSDLLELEITESSLMENTELTVAILQNLRKAGVTVSIDDFGTGYSSLAYLRRFPINKLKIDMSFIRDVTSNVDDASIVLAIISMAHSLHLQVVAEGVETAEQLRYLREHECDQMQGYYFSRPVPATGVEQMLYDGKQLPEQDECTPAV
ncbi:putative bifunctional diguanylate cyclase/phosphodiesterase [Actimicrobium antarcticum]|uniref:EAL domain-containing protein n=1 Tax=Actimicrobium antarcticum TaxID=1051899 RepID=A0ABP7SI26_9BURK